MGATLFLFLEGHIECIHMSVLPRILYPFHILPIDIPKPTFDKLNRLISNFTRQEKYPRIRLKTLHLSKSHGGLQVLNLRYYFGAAQL